MKPGDVSCKNCGYPLGVAPPTIAASSPYSSQVLAANAQYFVPDSAARAVIYAGFWRRFAASLIDGIIVTVVLGIAVFLIGVSLGPTSSAFSAISFALYLGVGVAYYVGLESSSQQATVGKRALGIIVTDLHGNRISNARALGRYLAKLISGFTMLIGYLMAGFTEKKQALHDMMAGTLVVVKPTSR